LRLPLGLIRSPLRGGSRGEAMRKDPILLR